MYLLSHKEATLPELRAKGEYGIRKGRGRLRVLLDKMVRENKWITISLVEHTKKDIPLYALTKRGEEIATMIKDKNDEHPLFDLDAFDNVKSLGY